MVVRGKEELRAYKTIMVQFINLCPGKTAVQEAVLVVALMEPVEAEVALAVRVTIQVVVLSEVVVEVRVTVAVLVSLTEVAWGLEVLAILDPVLV